MSKRAFNHSYDSGPRLRLRRPTSVLVTKCTSLLTCIETSYCIRYVQICWPFYLFNIFIYARDYYFVFIVIKFEIIVKRKHVN
jgi:hypothetical protein